MSDVNTARQAVAKLEREYKKANKRLRSLRKKLGEERGKSQRTYLSGRINILVIEMVQLGHSLEEAEEHLNNLKESH